MKPFSKGSSMNKWVKRGIKFTLFLIVFNTLEHECHKITRGFSLGRIQFKQEKIQHASPDQTTLSILNQPFHYYSNGNQCFVFLSEDGQYMLKFFKYIHPPMPEWTVKVPLLNRFKLFRQARIDKTARKRDRDFAGYQLALDHLRDETGLLHLHLHPSQNVYPTITIRDKLNITHQLNLNQTPFVLQKRAVRAVQQFALWLDNNEHEKVRQGISSLIQLYIHRQSKHIQDNDANFYSNSGFVGDTPIFIDPGHFVLDPLYYFFE
jgi:hypothetical protein